MAGGRSRRGSRASYADNHRSSYAGRRLSHLRGVRSSILWSVPAVTGERAGSMLGEGVLIGSAAGAGRVEADDDVYRSPSRRESAMIMVSSFVCCGWLTPSRRCERRPTDPVVVGSPVNAATMSYLAILAAAVVKITKQAMATEDNFFEKARRVLLRAIGVGGSKGCSSASDGGAGNFEPVTAEEIEAKQKIKVLNIYIHTYMRLYRSPPIFSSFGGWGFKVQRDSAGLRGGFRRHCLFIFKGFIERPAFLSSQHV